MARNYPQCDWVVNSSYDLTDPIVIVDDINCTVDVNESCSHCFFHDLSDAFVYSIIACYSIIMALGILGNLATIAIILSVRKLRIVMNLLLVALAFSDIIITVAMPFSFLSNISYEYTGAVGFCKFVPMLQGTAVMSGIYTLVVIAFERYSVIVHPFQNRILNSPSRIGICIGIIWVLSACIQIPLPIVLEVETRVDLFSSGPINDFVYSCEDVCLQVGIRLCVETWGPDSALAFSYVVLVMMYLLPLSCISVLYFLIGRTMWKRRPVGNSSAKEVKLYKQKRRVITFMIVLVVTFAVLWGPYFIIHCLKQPISNRYVLAYLQMMGHANVAVNPILYAYFHRNVRKQAVVYIRRVSMLLGVTGDENFGETSSPISTIRRRAAHDKKASNDTKVYLSSTAKGNANTSSSENPGDTGSFKSRGTTEF